MPYCMCCKKKLSYITIGDYSGEGNDHIEDGGNVLIVCYYGSKYDTDEIKTHICDDCIDNLLEERKTRDATSTIVPQG